MPTRYVISASVPRDLPRGIGFKDMHRLACFLLEDAGQEAHDQQAKSFTSWPLLLGDGPRDVEIRLHSLKDDATISERLVMRLDGTGAKVANLQRDLPLVRPVVAWEIQTWQEMAECAPASIAAITCVSPFYYSRNGTTYALPDPVLVHRQLVTRWNTFVPDAKWQISDDDSREMINSIVIEDVDVQGVRLEEYHGRLAGSGRFAFAVDRKAPEFAREWFASLWRFAGFAGIGAMTAHGLGAVEVELR